MKIVFASHNKGKLNELAGLLTDVDLIPASALNIPDIEETGLTFVENALLKARHAAKISGLPAIADDSGLIIPALKGAPGIYSARYAGEPTDTQNNIQKVLSEMKAIAHREAAFICVLVFLSHAEDPTPIIAEGYWRGTILETPRGEKGFGYDPIFFDNQEQLSAAELSLERKNQISHRAQALKQLINKLREYYAGTFR